MIQYRLRGDDLPRRLLSGALGWGSGRLGSEIGGCVLLSPRHEPTGRAWGAVHADRVDELLRVAEWLQMVLSTTGETRTLARWAEDDPAQSTVLDLGRAGPAGFAAALASHGIVAPLVTVLRSDGRVAGVLWLAAVEDDPAAPTPPAGPDGARAMRRVQPLLEMALRVRRPREGGPGAASGDFTGCGLTPREETVARMATEGLSNAEIAVRLGVAEHTVKNHMTKLLAKCGVRSRNQLIAVAWTYERPA